jgi:hypothetical protein
MEHMNKKDPKLTILQFNECINNQDPHGLENLLTQDSKLILGEETTHMRKGELKKIWIQFFEMCPDYKNHFIKIESRENLVIIIGFSTCSNKALDGPALWTAKVENDLIAEWRILEDTKENRKLLGIST